MWTRVILPVTDFLCIIFSMNIALHNYKSIIGAQEIAKIEKLAEDLHVKEIVHVNSVAVAGGVAELLNSLVLLANGLGLRVGWRFLPGTGDFFEITKRFHNALQGEKIVFSRRDFEVYFDVLERTSIFNHFDHHHLVMIHDPQALALIKFFSHRPQPWIWRCHVDLSKPHLPLWRHLRPFVNQYNAAVFSHPLYQRRDISIPQHTIAPAIDPLITKNRDLSRALCHKLLHKAGIDPERPFVAQVSRFDKWKDPLGALEIYRLLKPRFPALQMVLLGNIAPDDPEGPAIYRRVLEAKGQDNDIHVISVSDELLVNAVQRTAKVVLQWSLREGFGLTVSEALWKKTPVVARPVGGIPLQIINGKTGYLTETTAQAARACLRLLEHSGLRRKIGDAGYRHVRKNFLITRLLKDELTLWRTILRASKAS